VLLGERLVPGDKRLDRLDTDGDELLPRDLHAVLSLLSKGDHGARVILAQIISKRLERVVELLVGEQASFLWVNVLEKFDQGTLKRGDETGRVHIDQL